MASTEKEPIPRPRPQIALSFEIGGLAGINYGHLFTSIEFGGMVNGGYTVKVRLFDAHFNFLKQLVEQGYLAESRSKPLPIKFQIFGDGKGKFPQTATRQQTAIVLSLNTVAGPDDQGNLEFVAIDPPSWYLNRGDASGGVFKGRVDQAIKKVVEKYAPEISIEVGRTTDSSDNKWWMMRQDPKTFIASLMDWSSSITLKRTQWLIEVDGNNLSIKEQAMVQSRQRAFYRFASKEPYDTIRNVQLLANNAFSITHEQMTSQGISAVTGQYLDNLSNDQTKTSDNNTANKQIAKVNENRSFTKPANGSPPSGWTSIPSIPEIYAGGELGIKYQDYIDGRARGLWLNMLPGLLRAKFTTIGHGEFSDCKGLGADTFFVRWVAGKKSSDDSTDYWWVTGNWLVYGFCHHVTKAHWFTDIYGARYDHDSEATLVGGSSS